MYVIIIMLLYCKRHEQHIDLAVISSQKAVDKLLPISLLPATSKAEIWNHWLNSLSFWLWLTNDVLLFAIVNHASINSNYHDYTQEFSYPCVKSSFMLCLCDEVGVMLSYYLTKGVAQDVPVQLNWQLFMLGTHPRDPSMSGALPHHLC